MRRDVQEIFRNTPHGKQVMMFSATLSKEIRPVCKKFMQDVNINLSIVLVVLLLPPILLLSLILTTTTTKKTISSQKNTETVCVSQSVLQSSPISKTDRDIKQFSN